MGWLDNYRQASFRNVNFYVDSSDAVFGRRTASHEFPGQDKPYTEDLGRKAREFTVEGYILGDDYMVGRDDMVKACEKAGAGQLIHPYYGTMSVVCTGLTVREVKGERRMCRLSFKFLESGELVFPTVAPDTGALVEASKNLTLDQIKATFENKYLIDTIPYSVLQNVMATVDQGLDKIQEVKKFVASAAAFRRQLENLRGRVIQAVYDARGLANDIIDLVSFGTFVDSTQEILANATNARLQYDEVKRMFDFAPETVLAEDDPSLLVADLMVQGSVAVGCGLAGVMEYDSVNEAEEIRAILNNNVQAITLSPEIDDALYEQFLDLTTKMNDDIAERSISMSRLVTFTPTEDMPVCNLAYMLHGNLDEYEDIIARNGIRHPGFIHGGLPTEVLIHAE
jgi:prophage DNA circulation protein